MVDRYPQHPIPSASTIAEILKRRGCIPACRPRPRRVARRLIEPFATCTGPNATWCVDFKGQFRMGDGNWCYALTVVDAYSRFLIRCEALVAPGGNDVHRIFDSAFREFGLPAAIRSDNGAPFASTGAGGLTYLSAWWVRLGIRLERIKPGKPQQNGRLERFHRTLKAHTASPARANLRAQQRAFDEFRREYNDERPHQALGQKTPSSRYEPSPRPYPRPLLRFEADPWEETLIVDKNGFVRWEQRDVFVSTALAGETVQLHYDGEDGWDVMFGPINLGRLTVSHRGRGLIATGSRGASEKKVSGISSD